jgi:hypothetical protein
MADGADLAAAAAMAGLRQTMEALDTEQQRMSTLAGVPQVRDTRLGPANHTGH